MRSLVDCYDFWWLNILGIVVGALVMVLLVVPWVHELGWFLFVGWLQLVWFGVVSFVFIYAVLVRVMWDFIVMIFVSLGMLVMLLSVLVVWGWLGE